MNKDEIKGRLREAAGKGQAGFGRLVGSPEQEAEGERKQVEGQIEETVGKVKSILHKAID